MHSRENLKSLFLLRVLFFLGNTLVTAAFPFMGDFVNLLGSFSLVPLTFTFPSMVFIKVKGKKTRTYKMTWHWFNIVFSSLLTIATTISAVRLIDANIQNIISLQMNDCYLNSSTTSI
ncbi:putative amino acid transporter, transmembrane domain-containing protein [Lupinus albus]|uniref:Putative amino acid transporter, transmembrane domain-containing protein n=1 Tax=Lupinus albus TaxID=3870 RepID=A0A6A4Q960_LUPAL|nr:putative amino acid transporter, transmembrane domain-containing protein [Lupinus albus]